MRTGENDDLERRLRGLDLKPAPAGLRDRVLEAAAKRREDAAWTTPLLRAGLTACAVILATVLISDAVLSRSQRHRLQSVLDGAQLAQSGANDESGTLAEALAGSVSATLLSRTGWVAADRTTSEPLRRQALLKELLREDFDGSEGTENHH